MCAAKGEYVGVGGKVLMVRELCVTLFMNEKL